MLNYILYICIVYHIYDSVSFSINNNFLFLHTIYNIYSVGAHCVNRGCVALTLILKFIVIYFACIIVCYICNMFVWYVY